MMMGLLFYSFIKYTWRSVSSLKRIIILWLVPIFKLKQFLCHQSPNHWHVDPDTRGPHQSPSHGDLTSEDPTTYSNVVLYWGEVNIQKLCATIVDMQSCKLCASCSMHAHLRHPTQFSQIDLSTYVQIATSEIQTLQPRFQCLPLSHA